MKIGVPKEIVPGETRVGLVPACVERLTKAGAAIAVQAGAGVTAGHPDTEYENKGATIAPDARSLYSGVDAVAKVQRPTTASDGGEHEASMMKDEAMLFGHLGALGGLTDQPLLERLAERKITALALDCVPRITRAQSMDVLSSMSTLAGYKAVLIGADALPRIMPMLMTAAGTLPAAKVFILGAGVAGLQAIATAKRLGAVVEVFDTRAAVKEQVQSLGARFVEINLGHGDAEGAGGYAKALSDEQIRKQQELTAKHVARADIVITTALVPGRKAPLLVTEEMVKSMRPGSVVVDLAAEMGGNCALTEPGETVVKEGVTLCGPVNLPASLPHHASQMFSRNMSTLLLEFWKDGKLVLDPDDEIIAGSLITRDGEIVHGPTKERMAQQGAA